jgi:hypothetical protein
MKTITTKEAIEAIITYNTLPSQIDYKVPWKIKAIEAEKYLDTLPIDEYNEANKEIKKAIDNYYTPNESGYSPSELNEMF